MFRSRINTDGQLLRTLTSSFMSKMTVTHSGCPPVDRWWISDMAQRLSANVHRLTDDGGGKLIMGHGVITIQLHLSMLERAITLQIQHLKLDSRGSYTFFCPFSVQSKMDEILNKSFHACCCYYYVVRFYLCFKHILDCVFNNKSHGDNKWENTARTGFEWKIWSPLD